MSLWRQLTHGLRALVRGKSRARDLADEVAHFYAEAVAAGIAEGLTPEQAERRARLHAGRPEQATERARAYGWEQSLPRFAADLRFAVRQLLRHRTFTAAAVLTLALGIGANTAVFTVIERVLLAPLPYANANRICVLETHYTDRDGTGLRPTFPRVTGPDAVDVRSLTHSIAAVSLYGQAQLGVQVGDHSTYTAVALADAELTHVMGVTPIAGISIPKGGTFTAVVSEEFARDTFGSPSAALHQAVHVDGHAATIVGVLPGWFHFPDKTQMWADMGSHPESENRTAFNYKAVVLLQPGASLQSAQGELGALSHRLQLAYPNENRAKELVLFPLRSVLTGDIRPTLLLLFGAVAMVLLIACVNVTHLQLVRATERQHEIAVRKALGASRWQVLRPVLLESLLVSTLGASAGLLLAIPAVRLLLALAPAQLPHEGGILPNGSVLLFTFAVAVFVSLVSSLLPARNAAAVDPGEALKRDSTRGLRRPGGARLRDGLVLAEVTLSFLLAVGAGLLLHTVAVLMTRNLGYDTHRLLIVDADIPADTQAKAEEAVRQFETIFTRLRALPGVESVGGIMGLPMSDYGSNGDYSTRGGLPVDPRHPAWANWSLASPEYFETMDIPILRGRGFTDDDTLASQPVAIISAALAKQSFGTLNPIGRQIQAGLDSSNWATIVGVMGDVRQDSPAEEPGPLLYMPLTQHPFYANQLHIVLRTRVAPLTLMRTVQHQVRAVSPLVAMRFTTMDAMVGTATAAQRFRAILLSTFAGIGLALAMLGVYGTLAYTVAQRTFEIGLRMALGADRDAILSGLLRHAAALALGGIAAGCVLSILLTRLVRSMLSGVTPLDPLSLAAAAVLLLMAAVAAAWLPGRRATRIDPTIALRAE